MDVTAILGGAVCMIAMCGAMMWVMMRFGHRSRDNRDDGRSGRTSDTP
jgi:hypothetical protein